MEIRSYRAGDGVACRALWVELTQRHRVIYDSPGIGGDDPGAGWDTHLSRVGADNLWVAERAGGVVGLTGLIDEPGTVELEPLIVSGEHRGRGIGRRLAERVITEARARGHSSLSVRPVARNAIALRAFAAMGFRTLGHVELFMDLGAKGDWIEGAEIQGTRFQV